MYVKSQRQLSPRAGMKLAAISAVPKDGAPLLNGLTAAIRCADRGIEQCAERRRADLADAIATAREAKLARVEAYSRDALATLERRRAKAPADRRELLD